MNDTPGRIKKILVVDDDPVQVKLFEGTLKAKGYEVITSTDASDGLEKAMKQSPHVIILDVMMPIINGFNFCKLLKAEKKHQHIPIILVTSRDEEEDIKIGLEMGADAYLTKPVKMEELFRTIKMMENIDRRS